MPDFLTPDQKAILDYHFEQIASVLGISSKEQNDAESCLWCGKEIQSGKYYNSHSYKDEYYHGCDNIDCPVMPQTDHHDTAEEAEAAWNTKKTR